MLHATSMIAVPKAAELLQKLCAHYAEHGDVDYDERSGRIQLGYGSALIEADEGLLRVAAKAQDELTLSYVKMGIAEHLLEMVDGAAPLIRWHGDGIVGELPLFFREMRVVSSVRLTPHMQRVRLAGPDLERFAGGGLHLRLIFPPEGRVPVWPVMGADGLPAWPGGEDAPVTRVYTIRHVNPSAGEVDVDIVLHPGTGTPGADFAVNARPGAVVGMMGPGGGEAPERSSLLLVGDETALPAIARIVESLPSRSRARVLVELDGPDDEYRLTSKATVETTYLHRNGVPAGTTGMLAEAVRSLDWEALGPDVYVWAGCEFADFKAIRRYLRQERKMARRDHLVVAYWRRGTAGDAARAEKSAEGAGRPSAARPAGEAA